MSEGQYTFHSEGGSGADAPLLFLFHGTGGNEHQLVGLGRDLLPEARIVAPRGDVSEGGAARFFRRTGEGIYNMADLTRATAKMSEFVAAQLGPERPKRVVGLGYSNGANILASVLFSAPHLFDQAALMHPLIPFAPAPQPRLAGKHVLITAGERDPICPPATTRALAAYLVSQGADADMVWHGGGHEVDQSELTALHEFLQRT